MKGYPKTIATKQDFENLLSIPEFRERALADLRRIRDAKDTKAVKATTFIDPDDPEKGYNTEEIANPMPLWKRKGFGSMKEVGDLITSREASDGK